MRWIFSEQPPADLATLCRALDVPPACARVLAARGITTPLAAHQAFSARLADLPDPAGLKDMNLAVARVQRALERRERVTLIGDYDVDGVTATATLALFLEDVGLPVETWLPRRMREGYGLSHAAIDQIAQSGPTLLVALDCGIGSVGEVEHARERGIDVVILDHHQPGPDLPRAVAVVDPHRRDCTFGGRELCAAGLTFLFCVALRRALREAGTFAHRAEPDLRKLLDLTALGTIADLVPLTGINRILVRHGLDAIADAERPGVRALKLASGMAADSRLTAGQVGFQLAPKINAAGRLDEALPGLQLCLTRDPAQAQTLADQLDRANKERQAIEQRICEEAIAAARAQGGAERAALVVAAPNWHPGVVGIVASRLVERFYRPTVVLNVSGSDATGSARSIEGFHLFQALEACADLLTRFGGHHRAAGLSLAADRIDAFREAFDALARAKLGADDLVPSCRIDAQVDVEELTPTLARSLDALAPFGMGNPEPTLALAGVTARARVLASKTGGDAHLKLTFEAARHLDAIGFGMGARAELTRAPVDLAFHLGIERWGGQQRLSMKLRDLRASAERRSLDEVPEPLRQR